MVLASTRAWASQIWRHVWHYGRLLQGAEWQILPSNLTRYQLRTIPAWREYLSDPRLQRQPVHRDINPSKNSA